MAQVIACVSQKGGCGRSTIACNLAAIHSGRSLIIDLDPQGSALEWGRRRGDRAPDVSPGHVKSLAKDVEHAKADGYDLILIDTPPYADATALAAARASDLVLLPVRPSTFDLVALAASIDLCRMAKKPGLVVVNAAPVRSRVVDEAIVAIRDLDAEVSAAIIRLRVAFQHSIIDGRSASEYEPGGPAEIEIAALLADLQSRDHTTVISGNHDSRKAVVAA